MANNSDAPITVMIMISLMILITSSTLMEEMDYDGNSDIIIRKVLTLAITAAKRRRIISIRFTMNINEIDCDVRSQLYWSNDKEWFLSLSLSNDLSYENNIWIKMLSCSYTSFDISISLAGWGPSPAHLLPGWKYFRVTCERAARGKKVWQNTPFPCAKRGKCI